MFDIAQRRIGGAQLSIVDSKRRILLFQFVQRLQSRSHRGDLLLQTGSGREKRREHLINTRLKFSRRVRAETQKVTENGPENQERDDAGATHRQGNSKFENCQSGSDRSSKLLAPLAICRSHLTQKFKFIQTFARAFGHGTERIFRDMDRQASLLAQKFIEPAQ
jgi:hypothetical protein